MLLGMLLWLAQSRIKKDQEWETVTFVKLLPQTMMEYFSNISFNVFGEDGTLDSWLMAEESAVIQTYGPTGLQTRTEEETSVEATKYEKLKVTKSRMTGKLINDISICIMVQTIFINVERSGRFALVSCSILILQYPLRKIQWKWTKFLKMQ